MRSVNVGERIRQLRLGLGRSVRALAATTGLSPSLLSQADNNQGTPSIGSLARMAIALRVSLSQFFAGPETSTVYLVCAPLWGWPLRHHVFSSAYHLGRSGADMRPLIHTACYLVSFLRDKHPGITCLPTGDQHAQDGFG
jgi:transcriptional regulator with XRE-family HTH domain